MQIQYITITTGNITIGFDLILRVDFPDNT